MRITALSAGSRSRAVRAGPPGAAAQCGPEVEVEGIVSVKTGGCPEDCHFCSQSGRFASPVRAAWLDIAGWSRRPRRPRPPARPSSASSPPCAGPTSGCWPQARGGIAAIRARRHPDRLLAGHARPRSRSTSSPRWACTATTTTSRPRARTSRTSCTTHTLGGALGHAALVRDSRHGGVLRRHPRHGRDARAARRVRRRARRARPGRGAAELPQPAAGHAVRRPRAGRAAEALQAIAASGWRCRARCCATPAAARSPSATCGAGLARRHQRGDRRQLPDDARPQRRGRPAACSTTSACPCAPSPRRCELLPALCSPPLSSLPLAISARSRSIDCSSPGTGRASATAGSSAWTLPSIPSNVSAAA